MIAPFFFLIPFSRWVSIAEWRQLGSGAIVTGLAWTLFDRPVFEAMHNAPFYHVVLGRWRQPRLTPIEREYLVEWTRFKETVGVDGQLPQITRSALFSIALYFGMWLGFFPYVLLLYPLLGDLTIVSFAGFAIPLYLVAWVSIRKRSRNLLEDASLKGFRLAELRHEAIAGRRWRRLMRF